MMAALGLIVALPAAAQMMDAPAPVGEVQVTELRRPSRTWTSPTGS
jgi:hypothetical protein